MFPDSFCPSFKKTNHIILDSCLQDNCSNMLPQSFRVTLGVCFLGKAFFILFRYFLLSILYNSKLSPPYPYWFGIILLSPQSAELTEVITFLSPCYCYCLLFPENRTLKRKDVLCCMFPKGPHSLHTMPSQEPGTVK